MAVLRNYCDMPQLLPVGYWREAYVNIKMSFSYTRDWLDVYDKFTSFILKELRFIGWNYMQLFTKESDLSRKCPMIAFKVEETKKRFDRIANAEIFLLHIYATKGSAHEDIIKNENTHGYAILDIHKTPKNSPKITVDLTFPDIWYRSSKTSRNGMNSLIDRMIKYFDAQLGLNFCRVSTIPSTGFTRVDKYSEEPYLALIDEYRRLRELKGADFEHGIFHEIGWGNLFTKIHLERLARSSVHSRLGNNTRGKKKLFISGRALPLSDGKVFITLTDNPTDAIPGSDGYRDYIDFFTDLGIDLIEAKLFPVQTDVSLYAKPRPWETYKR